MKGIKYQEGVKLPEPKNEWERDCGRKKNQVRRLLKKYKKCESNLEKIKEKKSEYREACKNRNEKQKEKLEEEAKQMHKRGKSQTKRESGEGKRSVIKSRWKSGKGTFKQWKR